ncbi:metallophosphoesterase family protein [Halobacterium jilantaiense]|uniref:Calcineurin-like phosphoesterase n=1 Tax=Halobacterium jilantaiense TaxID=355548 RepID=A0A1I0QA83_9EURY|nr:metallophosphoesterase [Halobacterium jilantaiense]SEW23478.1 Calcineurin-like phosphoesterase [Halobacterium jilantaiense]
MTPRGPVLARLNRPRAANTRLAVVADPHVADGHEGTWKVLHRTADRFAGALRDAAAVGADAVVVPGDLTRDGHPDEFERVDALLADSDVPVLAVPGNHDVPKATDSHETPPVAAFGDRYAGGGFPAVREVGGLTVVGVNTAGTGGRLTDTHEGDLTADQVARVDDALAEAGNAVVVGHHPLTGPAAHESPMPPAPLHPPMQSAGALAAVLDRHDVPLAVTGHNHWPSLSDLGDTWELAAPAACSLPPAMLVIDVTPTGTTVSLVPLADREGLEEAYLHATGGSERARAIADRVAAGHLDALPFVDCHGGPDTRQDADHARGGLVD